MKKQTRYIYGALAVLFMSILGGYSWFAISRPFATITMVPTFSATTVAASQPNLPWPDYGQAALSLNGGLVRLNHGSTKQLPTASVAKVMTVLSILDKASLSGNAPGPTITLTADDVISYYNYVAKDGSVVAVTAGEQITERQALEAMLLPSANNMADTMAAWAFGSISNYVQYANKKAVSLGMTNSYFSDASGFSPATVSTASDLVLLGEAALKNEVIASIANETSATIPIAGVIYNVNHLLGQDGIFGLKTGNTDEAGGCFLFAIHVTPTGTNQTITVVGAIMGAPNLTTALQAARPFTAAITQAFDNHPIAAAGTIVARYEAPWGQSLTATTKVSTSVLRWQNESLKPTITLSTVTTASAHTGIIGQLSAKTAFGSTKTDIILNGQFSRPSIWWRLLHPIRH